MRFKTKDLLITILPRKTVIADAGGCEEGDPAAYGQAWAYPTGCGICTRVTPLCTPFPTCRAATDQLTWHCTFDCRAECGPWDVASHRRELERQLKALEAYEKALREDEAEPSEAEIGRALETLEEEEARLEAALDGIRTLKQELEDKRRRPDEEE